MPDGINFNEIPLDWRVPGTMVEIRPIYTNLGVLAWPTRVLLVGQMITGSPGVVNVPVRLTRVGDAIARWGAGSQLAQMAAAFLAANAFTEVWMLALADPTGAKAAGSVTFTGTPTANATLGVYIAGRRVPLSITTADTPTTAGTRLATAINADTALPVVATNASAGVVTLTAKHLGTIGNAIDLRLNRNQDEATAAGLTVALVAPTSGTGEPDLAAALTAIAADWFTDLVVGTTATANVTALTTDLARRYAASGRLDCHAYIGLRGTFGGIGTIGAALNSPYLTVIGANASPTPPWIWAASLAGIAAFHLTNDPARQLRSLVLPGVLPPDPSARFIDSEHDLLLRDGISTFTVASDGSVVLARVVTTYQKTTLSIDDTAWLDIMVPKTLSRIRYDWISYVGLTYPRSKLAEDGSAAAEVDSGIVTSRRMHNSWAARCGVYARQGWIEDEVATINASHFQRSTTDRNRLDARQEIRIIGNLMVLAGALEFQA